MSVEKDFLPGVDKLGDGTQVSRWVIHPDEFRAGLAQWPNEVRAILDEVKALSQITLPIAASVHSPRDFTRKHAATCLIQALRVAGIQDSELWQLDAPQKGQTQ